MNEQRCHNCKHYRPLEDRKGKGSCMIYFVDVFAVDKCVKENDENNKEE